MYKSLCLLKLYYIALVTKQHGKTKVFGSNPILSIFYSVIFISVYKSIFVLQFFRIKIRRKKKKKKHSSLFSPSSFYAPENIGLKVSENEMTKADKSVTIYQGLLYERMQGGGVRITSRGVGGKGGLRKKCDINIQHFITTYIVLFPPPLENPIFNLKKKPNLPPPSKKRFICFCS